MGDFVQSLVLLPFLLCPTWLLWRQACTTKVNRLRIKP